MKGRWLGYPLLALALLIAVFTAANITFAERPEDCAPEDREIEGNTNSPCKWDYHLNEITSVRYSVAENTEGNTCHEVLAGCGKTLRPTQSPGRLDDKRQIIAFTERIARTRAIYYDYRRLI